MLITMLRGLKPATKRTQARKALNRTRSTVLDVSGPLKTASVPERTAAPATLPLLEAPIEGASRYPNMVWRTMEMSDLPPELDPFEADFPWPGWTAPRHQAVVRSDYRSPTFEQDMQRVLEIFSN